MDTKLTLTGSDNYGKPRQLYADRLAAMDEAAFLKECEQAIWLSAYASNNSRSDYHWHADTCHDEAKRREKPELYTRAYKQVERSVRGK